MWVRKALERKMWEREVRSTRYEGAMYGEQRGFREFGGTYRGTQSVGAKFRAQSTGTHNVSAKCSGIKYGGV